MTPTVARAAAASAVEVTPEYSVEHGGDETGHIKAMACAERYGELRA